jgi:hypothetical protein
VGQELRDFTRARVPIRDALAELKGIDINAVEDLVRKGGVSAKDVADAFILMTSKGHQFYNMMINQSGTFKGMISNIKDSITALYEEAGSRGGLDVFKKLLQDILVFLEENKEAIAKGLGDALKDFGKILMLVWGIVKMMMPVIVFLLENFKAVFIVLTGVFAFLQVRMVMLGFEIAKMVTGFTTIGEIAGVVFGALNWWIVAGIALVALFISNWEVVASFFTWWYDKLIAIWNILSKVVNLIPGMGGAGTGGGPSYAGAIGDLSRKYYAPPSRVGEAGGASPPWSGNSYVNVYAAAMSPEQAVQATHDAVKESIANMLGETNNHISLGENRY